jgi:hypothetical protein
MPLNWRDTLQTLLPQFQAKAASSAGIYHLMVEVADTERDKMSGPPWFDAFSSGPKIVSVRSNINGGIVPGQPACRAYRRDFVNRLPTSRSTNLSA